jgi:hypothetical protein
MVKPVYKSSRNALRILVVLGLMALPGFVLFILLFALGLLVETFPILFYRGLLFAAVTFGMHLAGLYFWAYRFSEEVRIAAAAIALSFNVCFLVIFPVTIDRSISVYLLDVIAENELGMTEEELTHRFVQQYVGEYGAIERRLEEQQASRNVAIQNGHVVITDQGRSFLAFSRTIGRLFGTDSKMLPEASSVSVFDRSNGLLTERED